MKRQRKISRHPAGFTLIEAMMSIIILSFGVLSLAAVYAQGIMYASLTQYDYIAEKKAEEAVETIFTARDTKVLTWAQIQNVSTGGVFLDGARPLLRAPGPMGWSAPRMTTQHFPIPSLSDQARTEFWALPTTLSSI